MALKYVLTLLACLCYLHFGTGYPEIGMLGKLESDVTRNSIGWQKIANWKTSLTDVKGLYNFDAALEATGDIAIPVSGIFFVSVALPVANADTGMFKAALIINDVTADKSYGLSCGIENTTAGTQMLNFAGFVSLRAGENIAVYAYSSIDSAWSIKSQSSFTFHYFGRFGSTPAFLAHPMASLTMNNPTTANINTWRTTGRGGLFQSLTGLTKSNGKFTTVCTGVYILTANIIFEGGAGDYSLSTLFNLQSSIVGSTRMTTRGITTINVYQAFSLPKGTAVDIAITSTAGSITILGHSSWSMAFIGETSENTKEFASFLTSSVDFYGGQWSELSGLLRDSATQTAMGTSTGQFIQPSNLALINTQNFVITDQTELYYAFMHLVYSGNVTNLKVMMAVSANKVTATGKEGVYASMTKVAEDSGTVSLSGVFHIRKQEHLSIFVGSDNAQDRFTIHNTSFVSYVRMRYVVSAFNARIQTKILFQKSGWNEIVGPWLTETYGRFSYGKDFSETTGRFTASHTGAYIIAANIKINKGNGAEIGLALAKNGVVDLNNGFYSLNGEPSTSTTLNVYGTASLRTGQQLSLFAYKSTSADWEVDLQSGFSITYVGPNWAKYGFHAVLANDITMTTRGASVELDGWVTDSTLTDMTFSNAAGFTSQRYYSPTDGIYVVSANILLRNISIPGTANGAGYFQVEAYVNGKQATSIGLEDTKPSFAENTRDYYSLSFTGIVRAQKGDYVSLHVKSTLDVSYVVSKQSGFSVLLLALATSTHNQGLLGSKDVIAYLSTANTWTGVVDLSTSTSLPGRFVFGSGLVTTPTIHYSVTEPGIYYITGNFHFENAGDGSLFEAHAEIDSQSSVIYGLYSVESGPKGNIYSLNFAGAVYLTFGQQVKIMMKTSKSSFDIAPGSSFSIFKIQLDEHNPGIVVDKDESAFSANQLLTNWDESTKSGLMTSNVGYKAVEGTYTPRVPGVYITSINNYLSTATDTTSISLIESGNANTIKSYGSIGDNRTMLATSAVYLTDNSSYSYQLNSTVAQSAAMQAGWSLYFLKTLDTVEGFSGHLSTSFSVTNATTWMMVSNWTNTSTNDFSAGTSALMDSYTAVKTGAHFISFSAVARHTATFDLKIDVKINSSVAMTAALDGIPANQDMTLPVSGTIKLVGGDIISFNVYASVAGVSLTSETTRSLIFIDDITTHTEGVAALKAVTETYTGTKTTPKQLNNFAVHSPGTYLARNGTVTTSGSFVNFHAGIFLFTTNVMVQNSASYPRRFHLYSVINKEDTSAYTLQSIQTIEGNKAATLSLSSTVFLPRFSQVETLITASDDSSFDVLKDSTYTFILIDDNTGPVICEDTGLNMERLVPSDVRISTDKQVTFTCAVVGSIPATLSWLRNGQVIAGASGNTYTINPTQVSDSALYECKATYQSLTAVTNNATLSVYDPTPSITAPSYSVSVPENLPAGTPTLQIFTVSAEKYAIGQPALVGAYIVAGDPDGDFILSNASTTSITIVSSRPLDFEKTSFYSLSITAVNTEEADAKNTTIIFNVTVTDLNDNAPVFNPEVISTAVPEDLPVGSVVVMARAVDADSGAFGVITYSIIGNLSRPWFEINSTTGDISLKKALDRESEDTYIIIVQAKDPLYSSVAEVVVNVTDVNDNRPTFNPSNYSLNVVENILPTSSIIQVFASDPDLGANSTLVYSIASGNENGHFSIDSSTGVITLVKALDYETNQTFTLMIALTDLGSPMLQSSMNATVTINVVDINDNFAHFEKSLYTAVVAENSNISSFVVQVAATDKDGTMKNRNLTYSFNQTLAINHFDIDANTGVITLKSKLDYETRKEFHFYVIATDTGDVPYTRTTNVIIYVGDVNDELPYFLPTEYNITISEFSRPGTFVLQLFGFDNDTSASLQYSITSQSPKNDFAVNSVSGALYINFDLDRENITMYSLTISLSDGLNAASLPASVTIHVTDENDNKPTFQQNNYKAYMYENSTIGSFVVTVKADDIDMGSNAALTYSILYTGLNDSSQFFSINSSTGSIYLQKGLDYETQMVHRFVVLATDAGKVTLRGHTTVEVWVLDNNDNMPYFSPETYSFSVAECGNVGKIVSIINAKDNDTVASDLTYEIVAGDVLNQFKFMPSMPNVLVTTAMLDYENTTLYNLTVRAFDGEFYSATNATLYITVTDVNDNNPMFNQTYYQVSIPEDTAVSNVIMRVLATDRDSTTNGMITYSALENTTMFTINANTGGISVKKSLDFEDENYYSLVVIANDNGVPSRQSYALVDIMVTDVNDNAPVIDPTSYTVNISEAAISGVQLLTVKATDLDSGVNGQLLYDIPFGNVIPYGKSTPMFKIDTNTGVISLHGSLDYEGSVQNYTLTVAVKDKAGMSAAVNATVIVNVFDINDNQPVFDLPLYLKAIPEDTNNGTSLLTVHAADNDGTTINSNLLYYIVNSADSGNFTVIPTTGVVSTNALFDYETKGSYSFEVEAQDTGSNMLKGRTLVTVEITDVNDNAPVPEMSSYSLNVSSLEAVGGQIFTIFTTDSDSGVNSQLTYTITSGNSGNTFTIDNKGVIRLAQTLDKSVFPTYSLKIRIQDMGSPALHANVTVLINVIETAKSSIAFESRHYVFNINETMAVNSHVGRIKAIDTGNLTSEYFTYTIIANANDVNGIFHIHPSTGDIYMNATVDFEVKKQFDISVRAVNNLVDTAFTHVTIIINDVNEMPYFVHTVNGEYTFNVSEAAMPYTFIHSVFAEDRDTGTNGQLTYSLILSPSFNNTFFIDQKGRVYTKAALNFETIKQYKFQVQAQDQGTPSLQATVNVTIDVLDANDNHPIFVYPTPENITVDENTAMGTPVGVLNATDADSTSNAQLEYVGVYPTGILAVNKTTGVLTIASLAYFDYEKTQTVELIVVVKDLGMPHLTATKTINLAITNINDNTPYFLNSFYNISLSEVTPVGSLVIPLHAKDDDLGTPGVIGSYSIASGDTSKFAIDNMGKITLIATLSYSVKSSYHLVVNATDNGTPNRTAQADVYINVLDLSKLQPTFLLSTYYKTVPENNNLKESLIQVNATTAEAVSGPFVYSIIPNNNDSQHFTIDNTTGIIRNLISFDYEQQKQYTFTVQVLDSHNQKTGTAHVIIYVIDLNDNTPQFTNTRLVYNISEATAVGALVITLSAADNDSTTNAMTRFNAVAGDGMNKFTVETDGKILLKNPVDSRVKDTYTLTVKVEDMGVPALHANITLTIYIDPASLVHLSQPVFNQSSYVEWVDEGISSLPFTLLTVNATNQAISSSITYTLEGHSSEISPFSVLSSGAITVNAVLDYDVKRIYTFQVKATNTEQRSAYASVTIYVRDINNRSPYFMPDTYTVEISETAFVGQTIVQLLTKDNDTAAVNSNYHFVIESGNDASKFNISSSGKIVLMNVIDYEVMSGTSFTLTVSVQEGSNAKVSNATVLINVRDANDVRPQFSQAVYTFNVSETAPLSTSIAVLNATDGDRSASNNQLTYSLVTNGAGHFRISSDGNLTLADKLHFERASQYQLVAVASDNGNPMLKATAVIIINVIDVDDHNPYFKINFYFNNVSEAFPIGGVVIAVRAYDNDTVAGKHVYFNMTHTDEFKIDRDNGRITLVKPLDYEKQNMYYLTVDAMDEGGNFAQQSATVIIQVTEVNDNQPRFSMYYYTFEVTENAMVGAAIGQVMASDGDRIKNAINYTMVANPDSGNFTIDSNGSISLAAGLDFENITSFHFLVKATDAGSPELHDHAHVKVIVKDYNDNYPIPAQSYVSLNISEKTVVGNQIYTIFANDLDSGENGRLSFTKTSGDPSNTFFISNEGVLHVMKTLDSYSRPTYTLNITVNDNGSPQKSATVIIFIRVLPISMDQIQFEKSHYVFNVTENVLAPPFGPIKAIDVGNYTSLRITYDVITNLPDINGIFFLDRNTGLIYMNRTVDFEHRRQYDFQVRAVNDRAYITYSHVTIIVSDVNEMAYFTNTINGTYYFKVSESVHINSTVGRISVKDNDTRSSHSIVYSIMPGRVNDFLYINQMGDIINKVQLDFESDQSFHFQVMIQDSGLNATVNVQLTILDYNDNHPTFFLPNPNTLTVSENVTSMQNVGSVFANDSDSTSNAIVEYVGIYPTGILAVDRVTGALTVANISFFDHEKAQSFELLVVAQDQGTPHLTGTYTIHLKIDNVNDNAPMFPVPVYNLTISEVAQIGTVLIPLKADDADLGTPGTIIEYKIISGDSLNHFEINSMTGVLSLRSKLDYTSNSFYSLTIQAKDGGSPALAGTVIVNINVIDFTAVNPRFTLDTYYVRVYENINVSSNVLQVNATSSEANIGPLVYSIKPNNYSSMFMIENTTGIIRNVMSLDYEKETFYTFVIQAKDTKNNRFGESHVIITVMDINDNTPMFMNMSMTYNVSEATPVGTQVTMVHATDADSTTNGKIVYKAASGDGMDKFVVESDGKILLSGNLDHKIKNMYTLVITAYDLGTPSLAANITVTFIVQPKSIVHLSQPVFNQTSYIVWVDEGILVSSLVQVNATNQAVVSAITYTIDGTPTETSPFAIHPATGVINVTVALNYEIKKSYRFNVIATNTHGRTASASVTVYVRDTNDNRPFFSPAVYSAVISEFAKPSDFVAQLFIRDNDTTISNGPHNYVIKSGNSALLFNVTNTGMVFVANPIDYESLVTKTITLTISIAEASHASVSDATVNVTIRDENDNHPRFSQSVYQITVSENAIIGHILKNFTATDLDGTNNNNMMTFSLSTNESAFAISSHGQLTVKKSLDFEMTSRYEVNVIATDNGMPSLSGRAVVVITVTNANDNAPIFTELCNNTISAVSPTGMVVLICPATDKDTGGSLVYTLNGSDIFAVDDKGKISLVKPMSSRTSTVFNLTLTVTDGTHTTKTSVKVTVLPVVVCRPMFNQSLYTAYIREDSHIQTKVLTVFANDSVNSTLTYSMESGISSFTIDADGVIKTTQLLDYNVKNMYIFKVFATGGSHVAESLVIINIIDINNKLPLPGKLSYHVQISEKAAIGAIVIGINASDLDTNSRFTYSIDSGNTLDSFRVDENGRVLVNKALDYELLPRYRLLVSVSDGVHVTPVPVTIDVLDVLEPTTCGPCLACPPVSTYDFKKPAYRTKPLSENTTVGEVVATVGLNDAAMNRLIKGNYSIEDTTAKQYFAVNESTGQITLVKKFDAATLLSLQKFTFHVYNQFSCRKAATEIIVDSVLSGCPLQFTENHYERSLYENHPINQVFLTVQTKPISSAVYSIVENSSRVMFSINPTTGGISLRSSLDYETQHRHQFTVEANVTNIISYVSIIINVLDVNDNCPQVSATNTVHYQPVQNGTIVGQVTMMDGDSFKNHTFAIAAGDVNNTFSIDNSGLIRARPTIETASKIIFSLTIDVTDGVCLKQVPITIVVNKDVPPACPSPASCYNYTCAPCATTQPLTQCPDKFCPGCPVCPTTNAPCPTTQMSTACPVKTCPTCPVTCPATVTCPVCPSLRCPSCPAFTMYTFKKSYYSIDVYENRTFPSQLVTVSINGARTPTYSIVDASSNPLFVIDKTTGIISLNGTLDYSTQKVHRFIVRATVNGESSEAVVQVNVLDLNNNCPVFSASQVDARLTTPVESGTLIAINKATDEDTSPALQYSLTAGNSAGNFVIDNMGVIRTQKRVITATSIPFNLTITVSDGVCSVNSRAVIIIHQDTMFTVTPSKCPSFCPACPVCTSAPTNAPTSAPCQNVTKTINSTTCPSCPNQCAACAKPTGYMFGVSYYWTSLLENTTYANAILTVRLSGSIKANFSIVEAYALTNFKVNRTTGELFLVNVLDYERTTKHNFTIRASFGDGIESHVAVIIYVTNINDNNPYFITSTYTSSLNEYTMTNTMLLKVLASDVDYADSTRFSIIGGNTHSLFRIDSITGVVSLAKQAYLYPENKYDLLIKLMDTGNREAVRNAMVTFNVERITAAQAGCSYYGTSGFVSISLAENTTIGTLVVAIQGTPVTSSRNIRYSIANSAAMSLFQINATTGAVTTKALLDYETKISHVIVINAQDPVTNITSVAYIHVTVTDIDEFTLTFGTSPPTASVSELSSVGSFVTQIKATDGDANTRISYHITSGNSGGVFYIDSTNGVIRLNKTLNHDHSSHFKLTVSAIDAVSGIQVYHNITVNVKNENNKNIVFSQTSYTSSSLVNATVGATVVTVSASDPDNLGPLTYSIDGTTANEYFSVNSSGVVTLKKSLTGSGLTSPYVLLVCVTDAGTPATKQCVPVITITEETSSIAEVNNYTPYFIQNSFNAVVNENATIGSSVMKLAAGDNDTGMAGVIHYNQLSGSGSDYFHVNELTGLVTSLKVFNTASTPKAFFFTLMVRDHGKPARYAASSVNVSIAVLKPQTANNSIVSVDSLTMDVILSKDPFIEAKIIKYEVVAQEHHPDVANFADYTAMSAVSWYFVNFIPLQYQHRRFVIATFAPSSPTTARRKRREVLENNQATYVKFRVGNEQGCNLKSSELSICNGPLKPGMSYRFQLVGYYAENTPVTGAFTAPSQAAITSTSAATGVANSAYVATYWIIGLVVLSIMFFIAILVIVVILCYKKRYRVYSSAEAKTFANPMYADQQEKKTYDESDNVNFYATDNSNGYSSIDTLKNKEVSSHHVDPEEFEMVDQPVGLLGPQHSFQNYETVSEQVTFEEENPEWVSMDISLKVDPTGKTEPVVMTREKASNSSHSSKKASVSSASSREGRRTPEYAPPDYDDVPIEVVRPEGVRISVQENDGYDEPEAITKL